MAKTSFTQLRSFFEIDSNGRGATLIGELPRPDYLAIKKAFERLEGKWVTKTQSFQFPYDASDEIEEVFATGVLPKRNPLQLFPTPRKQVMDAITFSSALSGKLNAEGRTMKMLEPSIGLCGIADVVRELHPEVEITGVELDSVNVKLAREKGYIVHHSDFLKFPVPEHEEDKFDIVFMNPPFLGRGFIKHIRHAQKMLKETGILVSIIPSRWIASAEGSDGQFLDEISRTSSFMNEIYGSDTYEGTDCETCIIEMLSSKAYLKSRDAQKNYVISVNVMTLENDSGFMAKISGNLTTQDKMAAVTSAVKNLRNSMECPSAVGWEIEVAKELFDDIPVIANVEADNKAIREADKKRAAANSEIKSAQKAKQMHDAFMDIDETIKNIDRLLTSSASPVSAEPDTAIVQANNAPQTEASPIVKAVNVNMSRLRRIDMGVLGMVVMRA